MHVDDLILVSIDDHVVEPPDMFDRHAPAKYRDRVPHIIIGDDGNEKWVFEGQQIGSMGLNAVVSWPKEEWGFDPIGFAEMRPGAYDIHERVRDMNRNGILASMCFPTFAGFAGGMFQEAADKDLALARGGHLRVGLEDHRGRRATNEELVAEAVDRVRASGRPLADCTTAAAFLGVKASV